MKSLFNRIKMNVSVILLYFILTMSNLTINLDVVGKEKIEEDTNFLYSFWHRHIWIIIYYFSKDRPVTLASLSKDGEYITRIIKKMGWKVVRGSSSRGGGKSLFKLLRELENGESVFLTPDGPTGPVYKVKPGIIFLEKKSNKNIIPLGLAVSRKKVFNSWDRFVLPFPFTRAVLVIGEPVILPKNKSTEECCFILEEKMEETNKKAEKILESKLNN